VNLYTRREEMRATLIAMVTLLACIATAGVLIVTAKGKLIPDPAARAAAKVAEERATQSRACTAAAERLDAEIPVLKSTAKAAKLDPPPAPPPKTRYRKPVKQEEPQVDIAWPSAQNAMKQAKALAPCRPLVDAASGTRAEASSGWDAIHAVAALAPAEGKQAQIDQVMKVLSVLRDAPSGKVLQAAREAESALKAASEAEKTRAAAATVRERLPAGLVSRQLALSIGVLFAVLTLLVSFISLRSASVRRMAILLPLREVARRGEPGMQAAAILHLAAQPNAGEPGLVIGAGAGGLLAALIYPIDTDVFIAGVMIGLLLGLALQWAFRMTVGASRFRMRATELGEVEKPSVPIVLVLSGIHIGMEAEFITFFSKLSPADASAAASKLAAQAEERILAVADAGAMAPQGAAQPQTAPAQGAAPAQGGYPGAAPAQGGYPGGNLPGGGSTGGGFPGGGSMPR
jgi:hypothetical protein